MISADLIHLISQLAAPAFFNMLTAAALGALALAMVIETVSLATGKAMPYKFAQQLATMFTTFISVGTIAFLGGAIIVSRSLPWLRSWLTSTESPALPVLISWGLVLLFGGLYQSTFKSLRNRKTAHWLLGLPGLLAALAAFPLTLAVTPDLLQAFSTGEAPTQHPFTFPAQGSLVWPFVLQFGLLALALAGGLGMAFIVYRRHRDDWGRDYYNYALPMAARFAAPFMLLQLSGMGWLLAMITPDDRNLLLSSSFGPILGLGAILAVICCGLWIPVWRSRTPMQLKGLTIVGAVLCWGVHLCAVTMAFVLLPAA
ncbi:MAG: hypothetical protein AB7D47_04610 [Desulfovibrio sp.]|jgi:hypothetical protein